MFYCGKESSEPADIYLPEISGDAEHEVVVQPGKNSDKV